MFKVTSKDSSKLTIKIPARRQITPSSGVSIVNIEEVNAAWVNQVKF